MLYGSPAEAFSLAVFLASKSYRGEQVVGRRRMLAVWLLDPGVAKEEIRRERGAWWGDCLAALQELEEEEEDVQFGYAALAGLLAECGREQMAPHGCQQSQPGTISTFVTDPGKNHKSWFRWLP